MKLIRIVIVLFIAGAAMAQGPGMFPWWEGPIRRDIGLSEDQNKQLNAILRDFRPRMVQLRGQVETAEAELREEMDAAAVDARKTGEAIDKVVAARSEMMRVVSQLSLKLRLILTQAQWQELQKRQPRPGGGMRRMRPGGAEPGGPPL